MEAELHKIGALIAERLALEALLVEQVGKAADALAAVLPEGTIFRNWRGEEVEVIPGGEEAKEEGDLMVRNYEADSRDYRLFTVMGTWKKDDFWGWDFRVITAGVKPGGTFLFDEDPEDCVNVASQQDYLDFAANLPAILAAFERSQTQENAKLRQLVARMAAITKEEE